MRVHVVGAGLAGLRAALDLLEAGAAVTLHEAAGVAGGRCRSFHDPILDRRIDNGTHVILGANALALAHLDELGTRAEMSAVMPARLPFLDLGTGERWCVAPGNSPLWLLDPRRRVKGAGLLEHLRLLRLLRAGPDATVADCLPAGTPLVRRLLDPLTWAVMNAPAQAAAAQPMAAVLRATLLAGEAASRPYLARRGLGPAFVDPAVALIARRGGTLRLGHRLQAIDLAEGSAAALRFEDDVLPLGTGDGVVLAVPHHQAAALLPLPGIPTAAQAIVNLHARLPGPVTLPGGLPLLGLVGGTAHWLFCRDDVLSVTVSAADALVGEPPEALAARLWTEASRAAGLPTALPPHRLIKERRATMAQTPAAMRARPAAATPWHNLALAGDWTATGLPCTIEGALRSGRTAARLILAGRADCRA